MLDTLLRSPAAYALCAVWSVAVAGAALTFARRRAASAEPSNSDVARRVARNSLIPIASQLVVRGIDLLVAIVVLRQLGPEGNGRYAVAVIVWLYAKTISDFGLSVLATRDIAREPALAARIVGATTILRWLVLLAVGGPVGLYVLAGMWAGSLSGESAAAIGLLYLSIVPSAYGEAVNAALNGLERMDVAAWLNVSVGLLRAPLAMVLAAALGVEGVALAGLLGACCSAALFAVAGRRVIGRHARWSVDAAELRRLARESWPLLLNGLLVSLFFRVDVFIVQAARGDAALGVYDAAYKLINLLTIVPAYATLAVFPLLSRRAGDLRSMSRAAAATVYMLVGLAWVVVVGVTALGEVAVRLLAGQAFLPEAALQLRILIWFAPLSFANGVAQYVLVAAGRQRRLVPAFCAAVAFNVLANAALVPLYGARAAAATTVLTEVVITMAFVLAAPDIARGLVAEPLMRRLWRPAVAGLGGALVALVLREQALAAAAAGLLTLAALGWAVGALGAAERALLARLLPPRLAVRLGRE